MHTEEIELKKQEVIRQYGDWTAHIMHLKDDAYTYDKSHDDFRDRITLNGIHLRRIVQVASDITNQPLSNLRVLDLACLEGLYGIEFARHGAEVVGIEGRETNIEKARFVKDVLELNNFTLVQDDVRNLSAEKYGHFDVVLCLGILYHLDAPDVFRFVESISEVCRRVAIIDTHFGVSANATLPYGDDEYQGWLYPEHTPGASQEEKLKWLWASLDNEKSFWFTRPSLFKLLHQTGFTSVYTCENPAVPGGWVDRETVVAVKGNSQDLISIPSPYHVTQGLWPEATRSDPHPTQQAYLDSLSAEPQSQEIQQTEANDIVHRILRRMHSLLK